MAVSTEASLTLKRTFAAPCEKVFRAWTDPAELGKWWRVSEGWSTPVAEVDLRVGGQYRLGMQDPEAEGPYVVFGTYQEVVPPNKLVYTWQWEGLESEATLVTVVFRDLGESTEVELVHTKFPNQEECHKHNQGWLGCLQQLEAIL
ncbi:SRPBCC domain-containing protein [bacterium]|nr:SRPBCC domain-containing protein [bacterium]